MPRRDYCPLFGEHKSDPCSCKWSSKWDIECFLERSIRETEQLAREDNDVLRQFFLNGLRDGLERVQKFLSDKPKPALRE